MCFKKKKQLLEWKRNWGIESMTEFLKLTVEEHLYLYTSAQLFQKTLMENIFGKNPSCWDFNREKYIVSDMNLAKI